MPLNIEEFRQYLKIDKSSLDDEVVQQPSLFYEVSESCAEASAERDALKEQLAVVDADLDKKIRSKNEKGTEAQIKNQIQAHPDHQKAFAEWLDAKLLADKLTALKDAFKDRSFMIRELGSLFVSNYFEEGAVRTTAAQNHDVYALRRARLAAARKAKK
jgi:predicted  nucleic acid-binding Zn-ribbon protein